MLLDYTCSLPLLSIFKYENQHKKNIQYFVKNNINNLNDDCPSYEFISTSMNNSAFSKASVLV